MSHQPICRRAGWLELWRKGKCGGWASRRLHFHIQRTRPALRGTVGERSTSSEADTKAMATTPRKRDCKQESNLSWGLVKQEYKSRAVSKVAATAVGWYLSEVFLKMKGGFCTVHVNVVRCPAACKPRYEAVLPYDRYTIPRNWKL
jgi:hypothetical protein